MGSARPERDSLSDELAVVGNRGRGHVVGARVEFSDLEIPGAAGRLETGQQRERAQNQEEPDFFWLDLA